MSIQSMSICLYFWSNYQHQDKCYEIISFTRHYRYYLTISIVVQSWAISTNFTQISIILEFDHISKQPLWSTAIFVIHQQKRRTFLFKIYSWDIADCCVLHKNLLSTIYQIFFQSISTIKVWTFQNSSSSILKFNWQPYFVRNPQKF